MPYLKTSLQENSPTIVTIISRLGSEQGDYGPKFKYVIGMNGSEYDHDATVSEEKGLQRFQPGQNAEVVKKLNSYGKHSLFWNIPGSTPQNRSVGPTPTQNANMDEKRSEQEKKSQRTDISKIIFGYMNTEMAKGLTPDEAAAVAKIAYQKQEQIVNEIVLGI